MVELVCASFVTTTSAGSWLPGDARGYVERGQVLPPNRALEAHARARLRMSPVRFTSEQREVLFRALVDAAAEFGYRLSDTVVEATHLHWIIAHDDPMETMVGRLKNRLRQRLNQGRIWTAGYSGFELRTLSALHQARAYLARHAGIRLLAGEIPASP